MKLTMIRSCVLMIVLVCCLHIMVDDAIAQQAGRAGNVEAAAAVGKAIAEKASAAGVSQVAFDRSGFKYHGRVKALADAARENGLKF